VQVGMRHAKHQEVRRCERCGFVYQWPLPTEAELEQYYLSDYREDYQEPPVQERFAADMTDAQARVARLAPLLRPGATVLEIGSGSGAFLETVRPLVGEALGVEPEAAAREWLARRDAPPVVGTLEEVERTGRQFDLVVLFHVLEHVREPTRFLAQLAERLAPGGRLVVEVPNVDDALVRLYEIPAYRRFYYQKAHLWYFSASTLAEVLSQAGLTAEVAGVQRYDLSNHLRWAISGASGGSGFYSSVLTPDVDAAYADALTRAGHADTLWATALTTLAA
jgi:2-polyprenyl-3-methyl-5-hydroxy-6-metoxy-1,4-benzoquinol methylase